MPQDFTLDAFTDALTQLPEYGGYEALVGALSQQFPDAGFKEARYGGISANDWEPTGLAGQWFPLTKSRIQNTTNPNTLASYEAMYPALTGLINPQRNITKMGPAVDEWDLETAANNLLQSPVGGGAAAQAAAQTETKQLTEADFPETPAGYVEFQTYLMDNQENFGLSFDDISKRLTAFFSLSHPVAAKPQTTTTTGEVVGGEGIGDGTRTLQKTVSIPTEDYKYDVGDQRLGIDVGTPRNVPAAESPPTESVIEPPEEVVEKLPPGVEFPEDVIPTMPAVGTPEPVITSPWKQPGDDLPPAPLPTAPPAFTLPTIVPPVGEEIPLPTSSSTGIPGGTGLPMEPESNLKPTVTASPAPPATPKGTSAMADAIDITNNLDNNTKVELESVTNQATNLLKSKGWSDSGAWGYARTRNMLTGGGLGSVVTQGPKVPWKSQGQDASSTDYISNIGGQDYFPSRLSEADRLKSSVGGELSFVPENQKADYLRQNYGTSGGGEGHTPFNEFLGGADNVDSASLNTAITNFNRLKTHEFTANTFTGVDTAKGFVETILSPIKGGIDAVENAAENLLTFVTDKLGISDSDVKDPGFFKWLNTPLAAVSTSEIGIKPIDIIMIAAGGMPALGVIAVGKVMNGLLQPITSRIKGTLKQLFSGDVDELSDADKNDVVNEWERIMDVEAGEEDTNTYNPNNKLDVLMSGDYFISDPDRDEADQAKNWIVDSFENGDMMNLSGKRVAIFTDSFGNVINTSNLNIREGTTDVVLGPNNTAWGIHTAEGGEAAYEIKTFNGSNVTMNEWNDGKTNATGGGKQILKTIWNWGMGLMGGSEQE